MMDTNALHKARNDIAHWQRVAIKAVDLDAFEEAVWNMEQIDLRISRENKSKPADIRRLVMVGRV